MKYLITGGAGFIGSAMVRKLLKDKGNTIAVIDKISYASDMGSINEFLKNENFEFFQIDICDREKVSDLIFNFKPNYLIHFAAESHVDRSIDGPDIFLKSNIFGTFNLVEEARIFFEKYKKNQYFLFHHVSTDEVFGDLEFHDMPFTESTSYSPSSPYSATKASSDHIVRAWHRTYGLPITISNCSNNYGPYHFPEKLIPLAITNGLRGKDISVYGNGKQIRDWLYVEDHIEAICRIIHDGKLGETYNIGGNNEVENIEVINLVCDYLDQLVKEKPNNIESFKELINFVTDRPGHDLRYAIDSSKMFKDLSWKPSISFEEGLLSTVKWYLDNEWWWKPIIEKTYSGQRLGNKK